MLQADHGNLNPLVFQSEDNAAAKPASQTPSGTVVAAIIVRHPPPLTRGA